MKCASCGRANRAGAHFCDACGTPLVAGSAAVADVRKVVTIVFADLVGSTALHERLDPESVRRFMAEYYRAMRGPIEAHGGSVVQLLGDGVLCAFGVPRVAEDDAIRAVRAAVGLQQAFHEFAAARSEVRGAIGLRVAVNTGEVVVSDEHPAGIGDPLNVAARLQQEARDGDVLLGQATQRLVRDRVTLEHVGTFRLRGRAESVAAFRVVSLERPAGVPATPFVGREDELRRLERLYRTVVAERRATMAVILGSPGLGKSRLIDEFARRVGGDCLVLAAHCDAAGGATFAPIAETVRGLLGEVDDADDDARRTTLSAMVAGDAAERARVVNGVVALLDNRPAPPEETFFVVRRLLASLAASRPIVLAIDDLQWAEPLLLDLAEHLVQWSTGAPLLLLIGARPELRDVRSSLATPGPLVHEVVTLGGLDAAAATRLAAHVVGAEQLPAALAGRVLATSEGNPLFLGELVRMLVQDGALKREGDRWTAAVELATLEMPPTIHALLAARIESLRPEDRIVLERAAVVGRQFSRSALAQLLPGDLGDLDVRLEALRRSELIEPGPGWFVGEPALRFHHVLIRDAAYRRLLKETRAELHGRLADWIALRAGEVGEFDETIGWHLEQAHQSLRELGALDATGRALGERAARHLAAAGRRALAGDDLPLAASLLGRAIARLDGDDPARAELAFDWCEALLAAGEVGPAAEAVAELGRFRAGSERLRAWYTCFAGQLAVLTDPEALRSTAEAVASAADVLAAAGDSAGEAKGYAVQALALARLGKIGDCEAALDRALAAARRAGDRRRANTALAGAPIAALWGPSPVTRASGRCLDVVRVLRISQAVPAVEAVALRCQAVLEALRGRTDAARRMIESSRRMAEELGLAHALSETEMLAGFVELIAGNVDAAERALRAAYEGLRTHGLGIDAARAAALLGRTLLAQGRVAEAEALSHESEALAGDDLQAAITWRRVRAEALARRGEHAAAIDFARAAVDIAAATDALLHHADARIALAAALRAAGRHDEAAVEDRSAVALWEAKGATVLAARARGTGNRREEERVPAGQAEPMRASLWPVRANAATAASDRMDAALAARDVEAIAAEFADCPEVTDHTTGTTYDRRGTVASFRVLFAARDPTARQESLATLGERLALTRSLMWASGQVGGNVDVGPYERREIAVIEVDTHGRRCATELFAVDRLGEAIVRLYGRYAELLGESAGVRAAATARTIAALPLVGAPDLDRYAARLAPACECVDRRAAAIGIVGGAEVHLAWVRSAVDVADDVTTRTDDVLGLRSDALLVRWVTSGAERTGHGTAQPLLLLWVFGADGLVRRLEQFELGHESVALARFDALAATADGGSARGSGFSWRSPATDERAALAARFANAATRSQEVFETRWGARDLPGVLAGHAPTVVMTDRRRLAGARLAGEAFFAHVRFLFEDPSSAWRTETLATRGERLALFRMLFTGEVGGGGALAEEHLAVVEVDERCRRVAMVVFAGEAVEAAHDELDARYAAGEGAPSRPRSFEVFDLGHLDAAQARFRELSNAPPTPARVETAATPAADRHTVAAMRAFREAFAARDWDALAAQLAPGLVVEDHRPLGWEALHGPDAYLEALRAMVALAPDAQFRLDDVTTCDTGYRVVTTWVGTREGGLFEEPSLIVAELDETGRVRRMDQYDLGQHAEATARFAAVAASAGVEAPPAPCVHAVTGPQKEQPCRSS